MSALSLTHTAAAGTLVFGTEKGDGTGPILNSRGFRWSRKIGDGGAWYLPRSRDRAPSPEWIAALVGDLEAAGHSVDVDVDDATRTIVEREAARADQREARQTALDAKAARLAGNAEAADRRARARADMIPFGQPILVGHHSEGRHRRDIAKIQRDTAKSFEVDEEARETQRRAESSRATEASRMTAGPTRRRIDKLEADRRAIDRRLQEHDDRATLAKAGLLDPPSPTARPMLEEQARDVDADLIYWREHLVELEASGVKIWGPADFKPGDRVNGCATVVRVNAKTLTARHDVWGPNGHTNPLPYDKVHSRERAE